MCMSCLSIVTKMNNLVDSWETSQVPGKKIQDMHLLQNLVKLEPYWNCHKNKAS